MGAVSGGRRGLERAAPPQPVPQLEGGAAAVAGVLSDVLGRVAVAGAPQVLELLGVVLDRGELLQVLDGRGRLQLFDVGQVPSGAGNLGLTPSPCIQPLLRCAERALAWSRLAIGNVRLPTPIAAQDRQGPRTSPGRGWQPGRPGLEL